MQGLAKAPRCGHRRARLEDDLEDDFENRRSPTGPAVFFMPGEILSRATRVQVRFMWLPLGCHERGANSPHGCLVP